MKTAIFLVVALFCGAIAQAKPILPGLTLSFRAPDEEPSIGPGLGGSPMLVDTRSFDPASLGRLPVSLARSNMPGKIQVARPSDFQSDYEIRAMNYIRSFLRYDFNFTYSFTKKNIRSTLTKN